MRFCFGWCSAGADGHRVRPKVSGDRGGAPRVPGLRERHIRDGGCRRRLSDRAVEGPRQAEARDQEHPYGNEVNTTDRLHPLSRRREGEVKWFDPVPR